LRTGNAEQAAIVFREGVRRSPHNGRMLFGLMKSLEALGNSYQAGLVRREWEAAWAGADAELTLTDL
jgi:Flp pilus assembly protein TadD